jgi:hypothetical protein
MVGGNGKKMKRLFRGHRIEIEYLEDDMGYLVKCFRLIDEEKVFSYPDQEARNIYDAMDTAKGKIGKIVGNDELAKEKIRIKTKIVKSIKELEL